MQCNLHGTFIYHNPPTPFSIVILNFEQKIKNVGIEKPNKMSSNSKLISSYHKLLFKMRVSDVVSWFFWRKIVLIDDHRFRQHFKYVDF